MQYQIRVGFDTGPDETLEAVIVAAGDSAPEALAAALGKLSERVPATPGEAPSYVTMSRTVKAIEFPTVTGDPTGAMPPRG